MENIRDVLINKRKELKLSLRDAANKIGISHSYLSTLEKGKDPRTGSPVNPTPETLRLISEAYKVDYNYLLNLAGYIDITSDNINDEDLKPIISSIIEYIDNSINLPEKYSAYSISKNWDNLNSIEKANLIKSVLKEAKKNKFNNTITLKAYDIFSDGNLMQQYNKLLELLETIKNDDYLSEILLNNKTTIPILGTIRAGLPLLAEDNWESVIEISNEIKADFALRVTGDSMSWVGIHDGDLALLQKTNVAQNGQIVAAGIENATWEATLKFYMSTNSHYVLRAANPSYPDMLFTEKHRIIGTVVNIIKETPSIFTYRDFLTAKDMHDESWAETIEKAAQHGLSGKDVTSLIDMFSKLKK